MNRVLAFILLISFLQGIVAGDQICCSGAESAGAHPPADSNVHDISFTKSGFSEETDQSHGTDDRHLHYCIGCSHSPFLAINFERLQEFCSQHVLGGSCFSIFKGNPFQEGPFQPPKV